MVFKRPIVLVLSISAALGGVVAVNVSPTSAFCLGKSWVGGGANHQAWGSSTIPVGFRDSVEKGVVRWNNVVNSTWAISWVAPGPLGPPYRGGWVQWDTNGSTFPGLQRSSWGDSDLVGRAK